MAAIGHLNRLSTLLVADIVQPPLKAHILHQDQIPVEHDLTAAVRLLKCLSNRYIAHVIYY